MYRVYPSVIKRADFIEMLYDKLPEYSDRELCQALKTKSVENLEQQYPEVYKSIFDYFYYPERLWAVFNEEKGFGLVLYDVGNTWEKIVGVFLRGNKKIEKSIRLKILTDSLGIEDIKKIIRKRR